MTRPQGKPGRAAGSFGVSGAVLSVLLLSGCLSPEAIQRIEGPPGAEGTGVVMSRLPQVVKIIATYEATERQRAVAEARAREHVPAAGPGSEATDQEATRYVAVDTEPDERSNGAASIMLWDTVTEQIVGNDVYDVETKPRPGDLVVWETYSAQYVGSGVPL